jgi:uracil phosphoribosyltransferase
MFARAAQRIRTVTRAGAVPAVLAASGAVASVSAFSGIECKVEKPIANVKRFNPNSEVLQSRAVTALLSIIRDKRTSQRDYVQASDRMMSILAEEGLALLATPTVVVTPCGECEGLAPCPAEKICCVDIIRSGGILLERFRTVVPDSKTAKILIQRDESHPDKIPKLFYSKLPPGIEKMHVIITDPMLATGGSALTAIDVLKEAGVREEQILFVNLISCPDGLKVLAQKAPKVRILTAACDPILNSDKFIAPGLGDMGDRYYGTSGYEEGLWGTDGK